MELIVSAHRARGYYQYSQIYGYMKENESAYIMRHNRERELIQELEPNKLALYIEINRLNIESTLISKITNEKYDCYFSLLNKENQQKVLAHKSKKDQM